MKKSNKPDINPDELLNDFDRIISFINKLESKDLTKVNLDELNVNSNKLKKEMEDKYNPLIRKLKNNLDSLK